jgi:hypothetical protein
MTRPLELDPTATGSGQAPPLNEVNLPGSTEPVPELARPGETTTASRRGSARSSCLPAKAPPLELEPTGGRGGTEPQGGTPAPEGGGGPAPAGGGAPPNPAAALPAETAATLQQAADHYGLSIEVRPPNPIAVEGALPKPEAIKAKSINPTDVLLGAPAGSEGQVGYFEPTLPERPAGMSDPEWQRVQDRFDQRQHEFEVLGPEMAQLQADGLVRVENGTVRLFDPRGEGGFRPVAGDVDLYQISWADRPPDVERGGEPLRRHPAADGHRRRARRAPALGAHHAKRAGGLQQHRPVARARRHPACPDPGWAAGRVREQRDAARADDRRAALEHRRGRARASVRTAVGGIFGACVVRDTATSAGAAAFRGGPQRPSPPRRPGSASPPARRRPLRVSASPPARRRPASASPRPNPFRSRKSCRVRSVRRAAWPCRFPGRPPVAAEAQAEAQAVARRAGPGLRGS